MKPSTPLRMTSAWFDQHYPNEVRPVVMMAERGAEHANASTTTATLSRILRRPRRDCHDYDAAPGESRCMGSSDRGLWL